MSINPEELKKLKISEGQLGSVTNGCTQIICRLTSEPCNPLKKKGFWQAIQNGHLVCFNGISVNNDDPYSCQGSCPVWQEKTRSRSQ